MRRAPRWTYLGLLAAALSAACSPTPARGAMDHPLRFLEGGERDAWSRLLHALENDDAADLGRALDEAPALVAQHLPAGFDGQRDPLTTPLHGVVRRDQRGLAALLLARGASVDARDGSGATPLHHARSAAMVELLVAHGASPHARTKDGVTVLGGLELAPRAQADPTACALLAAGARLDLADAIRLGWEAEVVELLDASPGRSIPDSLMIDAVRSGSTPIVRALLRAGGAVDAVDSVHPRSSGKRSYPIRNALDVAVQRGHHDVAVALLEAGATGGEGPALTRRNGFYDTGGGGSGAYPPVDGDFLDRALADGHVPLARALLARGFAPDATLLESERCEGRLVHCAWRGHSELVELLLGSGAELARPYRGATAALAAAAAGHVALHDHLCALGAEPSVHAAAALGRADEVAALLAADPELRDERDARVGYTPLAWAVHAGSAETVRVLLQHGADPNRVIGRPLGWAFPAPWRRRPVLPTGDPAEDGASILDLAVTRERFDLARALIVAGARPAADALVSLCRSEDAHARVTLAELLWRM